jgi:hypothetical protein
MKRRSILGLTLVFTGVLGLSGGCTGAKAVKAVNPGTSASRSCAGRDWIPAGVVRDDPLGKVSIFNIATAMSDRGAAVVTWYETRQCSRQPEQHLGNHAEPCGQLGSGLTQVRISIRPGAPRLDHPIPLSR